MSMFINLFAIFTAFVHMMMCVNFVIAIAHPIKFWLLFFSSFCLQFSYRLVAFLLIFAFDVYVNQSLAIW